jgi:hypothetical protein
MSYTEAKYVAGLDAVVRQIVREELANLTPKAEEPKAQAKKEKKAEEPKA